jgi:nitroreductase
VRDIDIYLVTGKGLFRYEAEVHSLYALLPDDLRSYTGTQGFTATAPLALVFVSDYSRMDTKDEERMQWSWAHSAFIAQNVYLACAALGLATVVRSTIDRQELGRWMELNQTQHITLAQTLGYPAD